jgi:non-specific serine/threonine protein kinase
MIPWWKTLDPCKSVWTIGNDWVYDECQQLVTLNGLPMEKVLGEKVLGQSLEILSFLLRAEERMVSKAVFHAAFWGIGGTDCYYAVERALTRVRNLLGPHRQRLVNKRGHGWKLALKQEPPVVRKMLETDPEAMIDLQPGLVIPNRREFMLVKPLGPPGSTVWLAQGTASGELRVFRFARDPQRLASLMRMHAQHQALKAALGTHPGIVQIQGWDLESPPRFLELEFFGQDLRSWIARQYGVPERVQVCAEMFRTLGAAHEHAILHMALKSGNVLVAPGPQGWHVKLADWGSHLVSRAQTLNLVSPEIRRDPSAPATRQADVFAAAVLASQVLAGDPDLSVEPGWEERIPDPRLQEVIYLAAHLDPSRRPTAAKVTSLLESCLA